MAFVYIKIGEETDVSHSPPFLTVLVNLEVRFLFLVRVWNFEPKMTAVVAEPQFVLGNQRKHFFVCNGVHISDNDEFLSVCFQLSQVFAEQAERRIRGDYVRFF